MAYLLSTIPRDVVVNVKIYRKCCMLVIDLNVVELPSPSRGKSNKKIMCMVLNDLDIYKEVWNCPLCF